MYVRERESRRKKKFCLLCIFSSCLDISRVFIFIWSMVVSHIPKKIDALDRFIHLARGGMRFAICMYCSPPFPSRVLCSCCNHSISVIEIGQFFFIRKHIYIEKAMANVYLLSLSLGLCARNDDHLSRDRRYGLCSICLSRLAYARFCCSSSSNTILLANSHQFIQ